MSPEEIEFDAALLQARLLAEVERLREVRLILSDHAECEDADPYACTIIGDLRDALAEGVKP